MTCFRDWFFTLIIPYCKKRSGLKVLTVDNLSSHIFPDVLQLCQDNNIRFCCLPPNSTHLWQPLDVAYYGPMKIHWRDVLIKWKKTDRRKTGSLQREVFPQLLNKLVSKLQEKGSENLMNSFAKCGIYLTDSTPLLNRLPRTESNEIQCHDFQEASFNVFSCAMDMFETMRNGSPSKGETSKKQSKALVSPGKSTSIESLHEREERQ